MTIPGTFATLQDSADTLSLSFAKVKRTGIARVPTMQNPDRYTNIAFYLGDQGQSLEFSGVWIPNISSAATAFPNTGDAWITSSGRDPIPIVELWERTGQVLRYSDETGSISSCNITNFSYKLVQGIPLTQIIYYELKIRETLQ